MKLTSLLPTVATLALTTAVPVHSENYVVYDQTWLTPQSGHQTDPYSDDTPTNQRPVGPATNTKPNLGDHAISSTDIYPNNLGRVNDQHRGQHRFWCIDIANLLVASASQLITECQQQLTTLAHNLCESARKFYKPQTRPGT